MFDVLLEKSMYSILLRINHLWNGWVFKFLYRRVNYPHAFLKKRWGYCNRLRPSVRPSVTLSPPKPLDEIQPNLVCGLLT